MSKIRPCDLYKLISQPLGKKVDQEAVEKWSKAFWAFAKRENPPGDKTFVMMLPPPNVTGDLHLGHALTAAIQDALARQRRMDGKSTFWIPGFDHAGLATQSIVEKLIWTKYEKTRQQIGRENFIEAANEWKELKRDQMRKQLDRLGLELTRDREFFTMDKKSSWAVHVAFKRLFDMNVIYRANKPVFWSHELDSTLSDIEVERVGGIHRYIRTGEQVEQRSLPQWFISAERMARRAVEVVRDGSIEMIPPNYKNSWSSWLTDNGIEDWCISRQSWWGHRIPAYKLNSEQDVKDNWVVADNLQEAQRILKTDHVTQDSDVLDTWFSSSLLPLTISGWPNKDEFSKSCSQGLYPLDIMETGFDILTYWVSKMVMICLTLEGKIPFKLVLLHGMICDSDGKKMSKSKGNVIDPLDIMDGASLESMLAKTKELSDQGILDQQQLKIAQTNQGMLFPKGIPTCGADGLRAYLLSHDFQEEVVKVQIQQIDKIRRLSNKIWNIVRFVTMILDSNKDVRIQWDADPRDIPNENLSQDDRQLLQDMAECVFVADDSFNNSYRLHNTFVRLERFWTVNLSQEYMSNIKTFTTAGQIQEAGKQKLQIIVYCLSTALKIIHPFMPHLSEFIYQNLKLRINQESIKPECIESLQRLGDMSFPVPHGWEKFYVPREEVRDSEFK